MQTSDQPTLLETPNRAAQKPGPWRIANIIDGRALRVKLTTAALDNIGNEAAGRAAALDHLHGALFRGRLIAQERLQQGADGLDTARLLAAVQDEVISALYDFTTTHVFRARNPTEGERLSIAATGGYGRAVLAPSSDIDLLVLHAWKASAHGESVLEYMLYALWDMGLKVGHAFRTPAECVRLAREDVTIKTSLLDMRFICGDRDLFDTAQKDFHDKCVAGQDAQFIADKLAERDARHTRQGDTRYLVEPNLKEGKGGLRDLQTLYWIIKHMSGGDTLEDVMRSSIFTREDHRRYIRAARFFWTVRCHLHYLTGRGEERISFDLQPEIAERMGYRDRSGQLGVERFMKRYFLVAKDVGGLTRILAAKLEAEEKKKPEGLMRFIPQRGARPLDKAEGYTIDAGRLSVASQDVFSDDPVSMISLFVLAESENLDIHPEALWAVTRHLGKLKPELRKTEAARSAMLAAILGGNPGLTLRRMNEAGVLGRTIPEFGAIVAQTQFNMYHHFTVDEHTLQAVEVISDIEHGRTDQHKLASDIFPLIENRRALYLAMLLHDTGKGLGDQQVEGEKTSRRAARRLGLQDVEIDLIGWLVRNHLEMSETAQKRDISDPRTVSKFAARVGDLERLRLLYVLTVADIRAVGPGVWNAWKGQLLADLYHNTAAALRGGRTDEAFVQAVLEERAETRRSELIDLLGELPQRMVKMETAYWTGYDREDLNWHARELAKAGDQPLVAANLRAGRGGVDLLVCGRDRIGLFADLVGAIVARGANIVSAQAFTSHEGEVIDTFVLQSPRGDVFAEGDPARLEKLRTDVSAALAGPVAGGEIRTRRERREAAFIVHPMVQVRQDLSSECTVIDLAGRDRPGLLYDVSRVLAREALSIRSAHVGSYGERVFDAFYVQTPAGGKIQSQAHAERLRADLLAVLGRDEPDAPSTPARELRRASSVDSF